MNNTAPQTQAELLAGLAGLQIRDAADAQNLYVRGLILKAELAAYLNQTDRCPCAQCNHS